MKYDKLIRDNVPEIIKAKGGNPVTRIAADAEYWEKLTDKLREEVAEFLHDDKVEELADILEVVEAICAYKNVAFAEVMAMKEKKATERGTFSKRLILEEA